MLPITIKQIAYNRTKRTTPPQWIIVHDSGNFKYGANDEAHFNFFNSGNKQASADFFIDDNSITRINDYLTYYTWHVGDGMVKINNEWQFTSKNIHKITNANSIGIEICVNSDSNYDTAYANAIDLVKYLMIELKIDIDHVVRHFDVSGKNCPQTMSNNNWQKWAEFKKALAPVPVIIQAPISSNQFRVIADKLNVRKSPSLWSFIIGKFIKGDIVYAEGFDKSWVKCKIWDGSYGYVKAEYLEPIKEVKKVEVKKYEENGIFFTEIPVDDFKIIYLDKRKRIGEYKNYMNLGYFETFKNIGITLPVANLVADLDESKVSSAALPYLRERKILNGKFYMNCDQNTSDQFKGKSVSTLVVDENGAHIAKYNSLGDNVKYAVSGAPIIIDGHDASWSKEVAPEGWDTSIVRATLHGFLTVKDNKIIHMEIETKTADCFKTSEIYNKLKGYGFGTVLKMDGGGSAIYVSDGDEKAGTGENRQINTIGIF